MPRVSFPAKVRAKIYWVYALLGVALGATQVGFATANAGQPVWLTVSLAVFAFLGTALGLTAASNTNLDEDGRSNPDAVPPEHAL